MQNCKHTIQTTWWCEVLFCSSLNQKALHYKGRQLLIQRQPVKPLFDYSSTRNENSPVATINNSWPFSNLQRSRGGCPHQQRSKDLANRVCIQAIAGLCLRYLGQVCEEVLQGEAVMERDGRWALQHPAYFSVMAAGRCTVWRKDSQYQWRRADTDLNIS